MADLRNRCLKVEQPTLQALRDACADFARDNESDVELAREDEVRQHASTQIPARKNVYDLLREWSMFQNLISPVGRKALEEQADLLLAEDAPKKSGKMKVRICGRGIWNYGSENAMARNGWLPCSIMAKDCSFEEAIALCRN